MASARPHRAPAWLVLASVSLLALGLLGGAAWRQRAEARILRQQVAELERERDGAVDARRDVMLLATASQLEALREEVDGLWPADASRVEAYEAWLRKADDLVARLPVLTERLERLRERSRPAPAPEAERQRLRHPLVRDLTDWTERLKAIEAELERLEALDSTDDIDARKRAGLRHEHALAARQVELFERETRWIWTGEFSSLQETWYHDQLARLVEDLRHFQDPERGLIDGVSVDHGWGIRRRLENVWSTEEHSVGSPEARRLWEEAIAALADPLRSPIPGGLRIQPQIGLLPLGPDPRSGLWEFAHLPTGRAPARDASSGELRFDDGCGLVFVLLPGGRFLMGAQAEDPTAPNYDPNAKPDEGPVHAVELAPFFLSKYELTQAQWQRFTGRNPSSFRPRGEAAEGPHPLEMASWMACMSVLSKLELDLPTEAQWEYGARGGTQDPWWTGKERWTLAGAANLADAAAARGGAQWADLDEWPEFDDGFVYHAPVASLLPNPFGLHHVHGNVFEWCRDWYGSYSLPQMPGDGERIVSGRLVGEGRQYGGLPFPTDGRYEDPLVLGARALRGGSFHTGANWARSAARGHRTTNLARNALGLRPARELRD